METKIRQYSLAFILMSNIVVTVASDIEGLPYLESIKSADIPAVLSPLNNRPIIPTRIKPIDESSVIPQRVKPLSNSRTISAGIKTLTDRPKIKPVILKDSFVVLNKSGMFSNISGVKKAGNYVYELKPDKLQSKITQDQIRLESLNSSSSVTKYKLVQIPGKNFLISDGSFIVRFKNPRDKEELALDYNLTPKYQMPDATSYVSKDFSGLEALIKRIESDRRVLSVELDLIDPYIQLQ